MQFTKFIEDYKKLKNLTPHSPPYVRECINSELGDFLAHCQNAYYCFDTSYSNDIIYLFDSYAAVDCCDGDYVVESELCYEGIDIFKCNNSSYLNYCARTYDSHFCYDCNDSHNLFGCVYLNHKEYCIYNKQYSKEEYEAKIHKLFKNLPAINLMEIQKLKLRFPATSTIVSNAENSDYGNHVHYSKNMYLCFDVARSEDCAYIYDSHRNKNCFDLTQTFSSENCYECVDCNKLNNCSFMTGCGYMFESLFCDYCANSDHLFGCFGLAKKSYFILNKQYSKEDYEKEVKELIESYKNIHLIK
ncbi:hypothetical protein CO083_01010 [Candidatus Roizmanbacteria bacterium CG_4_9_14_0_8_um_filter_34_12]|uniref:Uncharacterized protein n=2 Tax=Candidatus Roizmaniibacteriota TaxID=1752723 RepID=A0A2M8DE06_9BACT|nr:MAG: hypothetical protein CO083_01010 [Candidatus Roizmanbacteria bacterium CG_4_9_14_0_8_um_filter_34_12]